jgi:Uncharacterized conserved protein, contains double-stranded beta-helix domain
MADGNFPRPTTSYYSRRLIQGDLRDVSGRQPAATARRACQQAQTHRDPAQPVFDPGRDIVQVLTEIPVGVESGWHTHPGEEVGYIVAGTVEMAIHGRATLTCRPATASSSRPAHPTTRVTSVPARDTCCPPTSSRPGSHWPRSPGSRTTDETPLPCSATQPGRRAGPRAWPCLLTPVLKQPAAASGQTLAGRAQPKRPSSPPRRNPHDRRQYRC